jgi:hypothetical protein
LTQSEDEDIAEAATEAMVMNEAFFDNEDEYNEAELYISKFFQTLEDDKKFQRTFKNK